MHIMAVCNTHGVSGTAESPAVRSESEERKLPKVIHLFFNSPNTFSASASPRSDTLRYRSSCIRVTRSEIADTA